MHIPTPPFALYCACKAQDERIVKYVHWDRHIYRPLILKYLVDMDHSIKEFKLWVVVLWMAVSNRFYLHEKVDMIRLFTSDTISIYDNVSPLTDTIYTHVEKQVRRKRKRDSM